MKSELAFAESKWNECIIRESNCYIITLKMHLEQTSKELMKWLPEWLSFDYEFYVRAYREPLSNVCLLLSSLVLRVGCGLWLYKFLSIAFLLFINSTCTFISISFKAFFTVAFVWTSCILTHLICQITAVPFKTFVSIVFTRLAVPTSITVAISIDWTARPRIFLHTSTSFIAFISPFTLFTIYKRVTKHLQVCL